MIIYEWDNETLFKSLKKNVIGNTLTANQDPWRISMSASFSATFKANSASLKNHFNGYMFPCNSIQKVESKPLSLEQTLRCL